MTFSIYSLLGPLAGAGSVRRRLRFVEVAGDDAVGSVCLRGVPWRQLAWPGQRSVFRYEDLPVYLVES
jgi:hypothetical protein